MTPSSSPSPSSSVPGQPAAAHPVRHVTLALDPMTHAELEDAAGHRDIESYLYVLAGRFARWNELRQWLSQLEVAYGSLPPEALERLYRQVLGLSPRAAEGAGALTVTFDPDEFRALAEHAGDQPLAAYVREVLVDLVTTQRRPESTAGVVG